jgi:uracil-DNA glycosylase
MTAEEELAQIAKEVSVCTLCGLHTARKKAVPGEGPSDSDILFIGEGPGFHENEEGRPFVGAAGRFLEQLLASIDLHREQVFICNVVKCRPPGNRDPQPDEIEACIGNLEAQIQAINPQVLVMLGRIAAHTLLEITTPISRLRGTFQSYKGIMAMPTYHPSYLLQNPSKKRDVWEDIKKVMEYLDLPLPR